VYRNIVVGYNGSDECRDGLALAARLRAEDGTVTAVDVYPDPGVGRGGEWNTVMAEAADERLASARDHVGGAAWLKLAVTAGTSPAHGINDYADEQGADLIVVGSSHHGHVGLTFAGTVGQRLLNGAPCPVAIAPRGYRDRPGGTIPAVVVGVDGSHESDLALPEATGLATSSGARLELVGVAQDPVVVYGKGAGAFSGMPELKLAIEEKVQEWLDHAKETLPDDVTAETTLAHGDAAAALAETAVSQDALLVVGSRAYGPLRRVLLGSVSSALVNAAPAPVLVVPRGVESHRSSAEPRSTISASG
jgi:nucleotide-binding universal stress UspA family protein